jgi:hypothetical protein
MSRPSASEDALDFPETAAQEAALAQEVQSPNAPAHMSDTLDPDGIPAATGITSTPSPEILDKHTKAATATASPPTTLHKDTKSVKAYFKWPKALAWIPANLSWAHGRDVFRCTLAGWISIVLLVVNPVQRTMGIVRMAVLSPSVLCHPLIRLLHFVMARILTCFIRLAS